MKRYAIWDRRTPIITPTGKVFSPDQWMTKYPVAAASDAPIVCSAGEVNGAFFGVLGHMVQMYAAQGADFSACTTPEEQLAVIETFEDALNAGSNEPTAEERIAAALEYQIMTTLPDEEAV